MKLKKIKVLGYRQLKDIEIDTDNDATIIAGANNCGKTSLVELFNKVFGNGKISYNDLSIRDCVNWQTQIFSLIIKIFEKTINKEEHLAEIDKLIFPDSLTEQAQITNPSIYIKIQIDYSITDDIRNFADYLMDLSPKNQSFYFIYEYSIDRDLFKKSLENQYDKLSSRVRKYNKHEEDKVEKGKRNNINKVLSLIYKDSLKEKTFYSDSAYNNIHHLDLSTFKTLFNYNNIFANRILDDANTDKNKLLSKNMVAIASTDENWDQSVSELPDKILQLIQSGKIEEIIIRAC
ncbi:AAA family ATPase [Gilliamella sp. Gris1-4]|uniref:AAA family ATPase n=1 Tax=Gilliamella sp. Gris1-4 TaxID=3120244 RepID=UPI00080DF009|nr:AAA family ATPase [Gilliamella apicola]OCG33846.1 hypothetical protein A9G31_11225 [Gilliamella apicola]OCG68616.1 hypothetical protein A9G39_00015 [Gilliamella apicola]